MKRKIIGFTGPIGSGKSYAAQYLRDRHGYAIHKMASPLKNMMRAIGLTEDHIEGKLKHDPCDLLCGATPRHAMQTLGTEWGRNCINENLWVNLWESSLPPGPVVCDDVRFGNENDAIKRLGGKVIRIEGKEQKDTLLHSSEMFEGVYPDYSIWNGMNSVFEADLDRLVDHMEMMA